MQIEELGFYFLLAALTLVLAGWLWLLVRAFKTRWSWGLGILVFPPLALVFLALHFRTAVGPFVVLLLGPLIGAVPYGVNYYQQHFIDLGPREKVVNGEIHITLTGWDQHDYVLLRARPRVVVLQMANADVDDQTLKYLEGMDFLRELDLNDTKVTDEGLAILARLPKLEELRLARTKISDDGFHQHLALLAALQKIDLTGTAVKGKTKRDWKKAREGRKYLD